MPNLTKRTVDDPWVKLWVYSNTAVRSSENTAFFPFGVADTLSASFR